MTTGRQAIAAFRVREGLAADGGHDKVLDWGSAFGLPFPIPNTRLRKPLIAYHDLHHLLGNYATDELGEALVSAWTLGTGGGPLLGRVYDLGALLPGLVRRPADCFQAFVRGRNGSNLYDRPIEHWIEQDLEALRAHTGWAEPPPRTTLADRAAFAGIGVLALGTWLSPVGPGVLLATLLDDRWVALRAR